MEALYKALVFFLLAAALINVAGCAPKVQAADLMEGIGAKPVMGKDVDAEFIRSTADFSLKLFQQTADPGGNSLVSPLSVLLALAMTANGADGQTLAEMEKVLGGDIPLGRLNEYLYSFVQDLTRGKDPQLSIANSIWFREQLQIERDFLQVNADYYGAAAYRSPFDSQTLADINNWVKQKTKGLIDQVLDSIDPAALVYLINAIVFNARWEKAFAPESIREDTFTAYDGRKQSAAFLCSEEATYLDHDGATGFLKPYADGKYSFLALLPPPGITIGDYIAGLSGPDFMAAIEGALPTPVEVALPKFSYAWEIQLKDALLALGMPLAFTPDRADFTRLDGKGGLYIHEVLHKTFIQVDEKGTKAAAVTKVEMRTTSCQETKRVTLDQPFVYAIIDNASKLPVFLGALLEIPADDQ
jgi:serpin B